ncbi:hypothetical protein Clacol_008576 [Clathrus columnatus]|uniref:Uncharacterized protein n=1 Tax=Clathrus columnatus TaxID=1419009 RepID=A0AAV5AI49_9AGAM|nr:hypothetical protein Clacol_008576 [Clathrus columnatus]
MFDHGNEDNVRVVELVEPGTFELEESTAASVEPKTIGDELSTIISTTILPTTIVRDPDPPTIRQITSTKVVSIRTLVTIATTTVERENPTIVRTILPTSITVAREPVVTINTNDI